MHVDGAAFSAVLASDHYQQHAALSTTIEHKDRPQMRIPSSGLYKNQSTCTIKLEFRQLEELHSSQV